MRARKYVAAYMAVLGGADAVIFGGGIGENLPEVRGRICEGMQWAGIELDDRANERAAGPAARINAAGSRTEVWVVRVDEASAIARETARVLTP
jgi:acetate kinase